MKKHKRRLDDLERQIPKPSVFPPWPVKELRSAGGLEGMRQVYFNHLSAMVRAARKHSHPCRMLFELGYADYHRKFPQYFQPGISETPEEVDWIEFDALGGFKGIIERVRQRSPG